MENSIELIRRYYAAFNRGDWEAMLDCLHEDVAHDLNQGERESGRDAFREFLARMDRCYSEQLRKVVVMANADGSRAAAEYEVHGTYKFDDDMNPMTPDKLYYSPREGDTFLLVSTGKIKAPNNQGVVIENNASQGGNGDNGNDDTNPLPAPFQVAAGGQ